MTDRYLIEKCLVEHCSTTLASMKSANLFNMTFADDTDVEDQIEFWNRCMKERASVSTYCGGRRTAYWSMSIERNSFRSV